jgi:hypothetical protein
MVETDTQLRLDEHESVAGRLALAPNPHPLELI